MKKIHLIALFFVSILCISCVENITPPNKNKGKEDGANLPYKVVAHRGGYLECGRPDCSISSLKYAINLGCGYSECDIVITRDSNILVVHPKSGYLVNGLEPFNHTVEQIRKAGKLSNGEQIPTLRDFLAVIMDKEANKYGLVLQLDVKRLLKNDKEIDVNHTINAVFKACDIVKEMDAEEMVEILVPTGTDVFNAVLEKVINEYKIRLGWATCTNPSRYGGAFAQLSYTKVIGNTTYGPMDYFNSNVPLVLYGVDTEEEMDMIIPYYPKLKAIFTNYPSMLIKKLKQAGY